jgi:hypothetical protein
VDLFGIEGVNRNDVREGKGTGDYRLRIVILIRS